MSNQNEKHQQELTEALARVNAKIDPLVKERARLEERLRDANRRIADAAYDTAHNVVYYCNPEDRGCGASYPTEGYPSMSRPCEKCKHDAYRAVVIDGVRQHI